MNPVVADNKPIRVELEANKQYYWCKCGQSENQPFCDGSHIGTGISPVAFTAEKTGEAWLCCCKQTHNAPYCDGRHKQVPVEQVGKEFLLN